MKLDLIYYKNLLDIAIGKFVQMHEDCFKKDGNAYVLGLNASKTKLQQEVETCIDTALSSIISKFGDKDDVFLVIGSCYPKDNLLLSFKDDIYFPKKLSALIAENPALKWLMVEKDVEIGIDLFNELAMNVFNRRFCKQCPRRSRIVHPKTIYVAHSKLDCYMMFKIIKWAYGSSNCCNVWKEHLQGMKSNLVAVNDLVSKYVHNKSRMNKSKEFRQCALEVKDFLNERLGMKEH